MLSGKSCSSVVLCLSLLSSFACRGSQGDVRPIGEILSESDTIVYGVVVASGLAKCGGKAEQNSYYTLRVRKVIQGTIAKRDIRLCGSAPILLGNWYVVAGNSYSKSEIVFEADAVLLNSFNGYYRLIPSTPQSSKRASARFMAWASSSPVCGRSSATSPVQTPHDFKSVKRVTE